MQKIDKERYTLGESPTWHPICERFYWVDIVTGRILYLDDLFQPQEIQLSDKVGCIVPTADGHLIAALSRQLIYLNLDSHQETPLTDIALCEQEMFNDGYVDCRGRFWVASKHIDEQEGKGNLYCFENGALQIKKDDFIVGNGIDWSPDNQTLYVCDSPRQKIYAYDFDVESGDISNPRVFKSVNNGYPDGLLVSREGYVLSAHWAGKQISVYDNEGILIETIDFDAQNVTSLTIGGREQKTLFVTSASRDIAVENLKDDGYCFLMPSPYAGKAVNCVNSVNAPCV